MEDSIVKQPKLEPPATNKVTLCPLDYATPLTIQTSPAPSTSGTDTPSDLGSAFNSPTQAWNWPNAIGGTVSQNSPGARDFKRFVVLRMGEQEEREKEIKKRNGYLIVFV